MAHSLVLPYDLVLNFARRGFPKVTMRPCHLNFARNVCLAGCKAGRILVRVWCPERSGRDGTLWDRMWQSGQGFQTWWWQRDVSPTSVMPMLARVSGTYSYLITEGYSSWLSFKDMYQFIGLRYWNMTCGAFTGKVIEDIFQGNLCPI